jgi:Putative membrane protein insertion efficiency factor
MRGVRLMGCLLLLSLLCGTTIARGAEANAMRAPTSLSRPSQATAVPPAVSLPVDVFDRLLRFFQQVISPVDGARSNMYPTGSAYARQVIKKHGALLGIMLTAERLMHEGNEGKVSPRIQKYGVWRIYDPVEANDWWWHGSDAWVYTPNPTAVQMR